MKHYKLLTIVFVLTMFISCDCVYEVNGIVLDKSTMEPIDSIAIGKTDTIDLDNPFNRKTYTDKNGKYKVTGVSGKCDRVTLYFSKENFLTQKLTFENGSQDTIYLEPINKLTFEPSQPFEVSDIIKTDDFPSSLEDVEICEEWKLTENEIETIITESRPINGHEWHYLFGHYTCNIDAKLIQNGNEFEASINGGAWLFIRTKDTTQMFGSFEEKNNKLFLDSAWTEEWD